MSYGYYSKPCCDKDIKKAIQSEWPRVGRNKEANNYNPQSHFGSSNVADIKLEKTIKVFPTADGEGDFWISLTSSKDTIYATSHNTTDFEAPSGGYVFAIDKKTCQVKWRRSMEDYSGIPGDNSRAGPGVYGDFIFFGSSLFSPQTWAPFGPVFRKFAAPATPYDATGRRMRMYCVNRHTGDLVWEQEIGASAALYSDPDNYAIITMSPIVIEMDVHGNGSKIPVLVFGQSSVQSFIPWIATLDGANPFGPSLYFDVSAARMTDQGKLHFLDALSGTPIIAPITTMPTPYAAGDVVDASSIGPGNATVKIRYYVSPADVGGGDLDPVTAQFEGPQNITWLLIADGANTVPTCLDTIMVTDNTGTDVALVGGAVIAANLNLITVNLDTTFTLASVVFAAPAGNFNTTDAGVQLDGSAGLFRARICKYLSVGDALDEPDAYALNNYGASVWQTPPSVRCNSAGCPVELYFTTGQLHWNVLDEQETILGASQNPIAALSLIETAQTTYVGAPSAPALAAIRATYVSWLANVDAQLAVPLSTRGSTTYYDTLFSVNLRPGFLGTVIDRYRAIGYDTWNLGLQNDANRLVSGFPVPELAPFSSIRAM